MKCVELRTGQIVRVTDHEADKLVADNKGKFVPKSVWKSATRLVKEVV